MKTNNEQWAVITGASKGLGYQYSQLLLRQGYHLVMVARNTEIAQKQLSEQFPQQKIICCNYDLTKSENCFQLVNNCQDLNVTLIINNAGYGILGNFLDQDLTSQLDMISLNINAVQILTKEFLTIFEKKQNGRVINIASVASFMPGPAFASYYASKAYVLNLSIAINSELKFQKKLSRVVCICPGTLKTAFWERSSTQASQKITESKMPIMNLQKFAQKSLLRACKTKNKNYILVGFWNHVLILAIKFLPKRLILPMIFKLQNGR